MCTNVSVNKQYSHAPLPTSRKRPMKTFDIGVDLDAVGYNLQSTLAPYARKHGYPLATDQIWNHIDSETGRHGGFSSCGIKDYDEFLSLCSKAVNDGVLYSTGCPFPGFL